MTAVVKIPSNDTGLSYAEEDSPGVLPVTPVWYPLEPNSYSDFGGSLKTIARNPINASRQRSKGVITDLDAQGGFESDVTLENLKDILQGFFLADLRYKDKLTVTSVSGSGLLSPPRRRPASAPSLLPAAKVTGGRLTASDAPIAR